MIARKIRRSLPVIMPLVALVTACSSDSGFSFRLVGTDFNVPVAGGGSDAHSVLAAPYLTFNFGIGDPHVAVSVYDGRVVRGRSLELPASLETRGLRVTARVNNADYSSEDPSSTGIVEVIDYSLGSVPTIRVKIDGNLASNKSTLLRLSGTAQVP